MAEEAAASVPEDDLVAPRTKKDQSSCDAECVALVVKVVIVVLFVWPLLHFALFRSSQEGVLQQDSVVEETLQSLQEGPLEGNKSAEVEVRRVLQEPQPTCPKSYMLRILAGMCQDLFLLHEQCTAADVDNLEKHKLPIRVTNTAKSNTTGEPRGTIVGCAAAGLLLTSLGAAVLELYRAKSGGDKTSNKAKPALSRKCSLADLTVLKHNRKELVRRESILEGPEPNNQPGRKVSRPPLRLD